MKLCALSVWTSDGFPLWALIVAVLAAVLLIAILIGVQCARVAKRNRFVSAPDWTPEAKLCIEDARREIQNGLVESLRTEFGSNIPEGEKRMLEFLSETFAERSGGQYIPVESFSGFIRSKPNLRLQGSDIIGGVSVIPVRISERGSKYFFLEGLAFCYRRDDFQYIAKYNICFYPEKAGQPIENALEFEDYETTI